MAKPLISDELWAVVEPLLPAPKPRRFRYPGRKPVDNRKALTGIVFVLKTGIPWQALPGDLGVCGMTSAGTSCTSGSRLAATARSAAGPPAGGRQD
jgi:hypothetical protein